MKYAGYYNIELLIPFGLHHVLNSFIWFVFGSYTDAAGQVWTGDLNRFFYVDPTVGSLNVSEFSAKLVERLGGKANIVGTRAELIADEMKKSIKM